MDTPQGSVHRKEGMMNDCLHAGRGRCPISKSACPGICVYADIMENINIGIVVFDIPHRRIIFQNRTSIEMFKEDISPGDYEALQQMLIPEMDKFLSSPNPYSPKPIKYRNRIYGYTAYQISDRRFAWIFIRDITDKARLVSIAEAVNTMNNIGYIFSGIRHEIGNPVNSIKMTLSVLKNNLDKYPRETIMEYVDRALEEVGRIEYLLRSLKNFNMYEKPEMQEIHIPSFIDRFLSLVSRDFEQKGIRIIKNIHPYAEWAYADPRALQQVLLNVFTNASDALNDREDPQIQLNVTPQFDGILILIIDNGCGIPEEVKEVLFRPFVTTKPDGTGLGLVITKKLLAKMGGTIEIESRQGVGTAVKIVIPGKEGWQLRAHDAEHY